LKLIKGGMSPGLEFLLVSEQIYQPDTAVGTNLAAGDNSLATNEKRLATGGRYKIE
jgi:hypothetical protein